jgi:hypothetical protein
MTPNDDTAAQGLAPVPVRPEPDYLANNWWHLVHEIDKVPPHRTDWLCARLADITRWALEHHSTWVVQDRIRELAVEIKAAHDAGWPNAELSHRP